LRLSLNSILGPQGSKTSHGESMNIVQAATAGLMLTTSFGGDVNNHLVNRRVEMMGTVLWMELEAEDRTEGLRASEGALKAMEAAERRLSTWTTESELACFLASEVGERVTLTPLLAKELSAAAELCELTGGAFDPSIGALTNAWGLRTGAMTPDESTLREAMESCGSALWRIEGSEAIRESADLVIDEGGFGKGAALDQALISLRESGVESASLNFGGQLAFIGEDERVVPIADPRDRRDVVIELKVDGGSVATSANTERSGHLLDPRTGRPAKDFGSVTVWASSALTADALATALFVLGPKEGHALAEKMEGVEAAFIETSKSGVSVYLTSGLSNRTRSLHQRARVIDSIDLRGQRAATNKTSNLRNEILQSLRCYRTVSDLGLRAKQ
jgi:FAD:protein FMN transferase